MIYGEVTVSRDLVNTVFSLQTCNVGGDVPNSPGVPNSTDRRILTRLRIDAARCEPASIKATAWIAVFACTPSAVGGSILRRFCFHEIRRLLHKASKEYADHHGMPWNDDTFARTIPGLGVSFAQRIAEAHDLTAMVKAG